MNPSQLLDISALLALLPATLLGRRPGVTQTMDRLLLAVAAAGPLALVVVRLTTGWETGLGSALWLSVTATVTLFALLVVLEREAWRLAPLLFPYLVLVAALAALWSSVESGSSAIGNLDAWLEIHIGASLVAYGLATLAAIAAAAVVLQERVLKRHRPTDWTHGLPALAVAERLELRLLVAVLVALLVSISSGMAEGYETGGPLLAFDHKTLLALLAFALVGLLLLAHRLSGLRGRRAARLVLLVYLLLTLAYPGVKFVTEALLT